MKKFEMMNKIEEIVEKTIELLNDCGEATRISNDFYNNNTDEYIDSYNFREVMARRNECPISALEYHMSYDREHMEDITAYELKDDLKAVKNFYKFVKNFVENHPELVEQYEKEKEEMYAKWRKEDEETYDKFDKSFSDEDIKEATEIVMTITNKVKNNFNYKFTDDEIKIVGVLLHDPDVDFKYDFEVGHPILPGNLIKNKDYNFDRAYNLISNLGNIIKRYNNKIKIRACETLIYAINEFIDYCYS